MSISKLPNGRYRCQVYNPATGKNVSAAKVLGLPVASFETKAEAKAAREDARRKLREQQTDSMTVAGWAALWTSARRYQRPKESTNITNRNGIRAFVKEHGHRELASIDRKLASRWLREDGRDYMIQSLRAMFGDAVKDDLIPGNPFSSLEVRRSRGNADKRPPSVEQVETLIAAAEATVSPYFAGWLATAAFSGCRPGEVDALSWDGVDLATNRIHVREQYSAQSGTFTTPKNGKDRIVLLPPQARDVLVRLPRVSDYCFVNFKGRHYSKSSRTYPWAMLRHIVDNRSLYLSTRHFAGWYMVNVLEMDSEDVAFQLGHEDGGELVRRLYGHRDRRLAIARAERAFETAHRNAHGRDDDGQIRLRSVR